MGQLGDAQRLPGASRDLRQGVQLDGHARLHRGGAENRRRLPALRVRRPLRARAGRHVQSRAGPTLAAPLVILYSKQWARNTAPPYAHADTAWVSSTGLA